MLVSALRVLLIAVSLGLDVFAVSIGVGIRGATTGAKVRIGAAFATAEVVMNLAGAGLGAVVGRAIGDVAGYIGFAALGGVGIYMIFEATRQTEEDFDLSRGWGLMLASLSISLDSLGIGFSILYLGVPVAFTLGTIALVSIASTALGLAFGRAFGKRVEESAGWIAGFVLLATGVLFAALKYFHVG